MQKPITYVLAALVLSAAPLAAQQKADPKPMSHDMAGMKHDATIEGWDAHMKEHFDGITLTDDQKTQIVASHKQHQGMIAKLKEGGTMDEKTIKSIKAHEDAEHGSFKKIIGDEAFMKFEANMKKMEAMDKAPAPVKKP